MKAIQFEVRQPGSAVERTLFEGTLARIGHAAHCDIRLAVDQAAEEHLTIEAIGDQLELTTLASPAPLVDGIKMASGRIPSGATIVLGGVPITVVAVLDESAGKGQAAKRTKILYGVCAALAAAASVMMMTDPVAEEARREPDVKLFPDRPTSCPHEAKDEALAFAYDELEVADSKAERHPFVPRDGVSAVVQYEVAAQCFHAAGDDRMAAGVTVIANTLRESITADFRARTLRLEYSLRAKDGALAMADVMFLRTLTEDRKGPYYAWLDEVLRQMKQGETK